MPVFSGLHAASLNVVPLRERVLRKRWEPGPVQSDCIRQEKSGFG